jgi:transposase InsO family protein
MAEISDQKGSRASKEVWHARLGHASAARVRETQAATKGLVISNAITPSRCGDCGAEKITRQTFPRQEKRIIQKLETVHSDVVGPVETTSGGHKYFITFLDDATRFLFTDPMTSKEGREIGAILQDWMAKAERQASRQLQNLRTDGALEYTRGAVGMLLKSKGVQAQVAVPRSPEQNGVAERLNRTLEEGVRTMIRRAGLPLSWWDKALQAVSAAAEE